MLQSQYYDDGHTIDQMFMTIGNVLVMPNVYHDYKWSMILEEKTHGYDNKSHNCNQGGCLFDVSNQSHIKWENAEIKYDLKES